LLFYLGFTLDTPDVLRPLSVFGWILLVCGMGLVVWSIVALARSRDAGLIEGGVYGLVRHPMYLGAMVCFLAFFFFCPHVLVLSIVALNLAVVYAFILQGERQNALKFGDAYRRYMETVPRINLLAGILRRLRRR
jgi:protein-S-isoprenylcysteine O-methyltransferase Ste14